MCYKNTFICTFGETQNIINYPNFYQLAIPSVDINTLNDIKKLSVWAIICGDLRIACTDNSLIPDACIYQHNIRLFDKGLDNDMLDESMTYGACMAMSVLQIAFSWSSWIAVMIYYDSWSSWIAVMIYDLPQI